MRTVDLGLLLSASVSLARSAAHIIRSVSASGKLGTIEKGPDDPMTVISQHPQCVFVF
jgi:hypothetical protein